MCKCSVCTQPSGWRPFSDPCCCRCWPHCLAGRDVEVTSEPGSGKTLGFLLPAVVQLQELGHDAGTEPQGPVALVLVPTR